MYLLLGVLLVVFDIALEFHRLLNGLGHGFCHVRARRGGDNSIHARWLCQLKVTLFINDDGPIAIFFRLVGYGNGLLPGLQDGLVLGNGSFSCLGTRQALEEDEGGIVQDQKGLQKVTKARGKDAQNGRHGLADPQASSREGSRIQGRKADAGDSTECRAKDGKGKASGLTKFVSDHSWKGNRRGFNLTFACKVRRLKAHTVGVAAVVTNDWL